MCFSSDQCHQLSTRGLPEYYVAIVARRSTVDVLWMIRHCTVLCRYTPVGIDGAVYRVDRFLDLCFNIAFALSSADSSPSLALCSYGNMANDSDLTCS